MSVDKLLHPAHVAILRVLLFAPAARFAELQKASELSSDHFNFYLKQLLDEDYVAKDQSGKYSLTRKGKEFANRFDTDARTVERQPKVAVCLVIHDGQGRTLMQQRLKQPYFGYWGRPTGKIRWSETIMEAAARELMEETNLTATLTMRGTQHKMDYNKQTGDLLEDKIFFILHGANPMGKMFEEFEGGRNQWMTWEEIKELEHSFTNDDTVVKDAEGPLFFVESRHEYDPKHY
ncbi:MAG TPA: NUDIX domain-containing protein [Candidatus Saccharimonadales bacterium]|nr:NUDIX domain-containing protein [Candidatus Saccharimonadales bacterium]